jgi:hypothetical protein
MHSLGHRFAARDQMRPAEEALPVATNGHRIAGLSVIEYEAN